MKTISRILTTLTLLAACQSLGAVVASPVPFKYTQPDGTVITLQMHGDEFHSWITCDGVIVEKGADGFYRRAASVKPSYISAPKRMTRENASLPANASISNGSHRFIAILIEFSDLAFTVPSPHEAFNNLLNQKGYSNNNATGSVYDYYYSNSQGKFNPTFDVYGPVTLSRSYKYYGQHSGNDSDAHADEALYEACNILHETTDIDFSQYDIDKDGYVDGVFFFFAGHNEAEGGGEDTIWPHAWALYYYPNTTFDGVTVHAYACTSEYRSTGKDMCGIGTFCHEFGHTLGIPDFYDTDYETNGQSENVFSFSTWGHGSYNNDGRTPPAMSAFEKEMLGWGTIPTWTASGEKTLKPTYNNDVSVSSGKTLTDNNGEYFYYESRGGDNVWDSYLPATGLLVYHVDKSKNNVGSGKTAASLWNGSNNINAYASHPCYYIKKASNISTSYIPFPGAGKVTSFNDARKWDGEHSGVYLTKIQHNTSTGITSFSLEFDTDKKVLGTVTDNEGKPMANAMIAIKIRKPSMSPAAAMDKTPSCVDFMEAASSADYTAVSRSDGSYAIDLNTGETEFTLYAVKEGYYTKAYDFTLTTGRCTQDVVLYPRSDEQRKPYTLRKYEDVSKISMGYGTAPTSIMGSVLFTADELRNNVGDTLSSITFQISGSSADQVHVLVDINNKRVLWQQVNYVKFGGMTTVNIKSKGITIPENANVYIGYAVKNSNYGYPLSITTTSKTTGGCMYSSYNASTSSWNEYADHDLIVSAEVEPWDPSSEPEFPGSTAISRAGFNTIDAASTYADGTSYTFAIVRSHVKSPQSVKWYFDGIEQRGESVVLRTGTHVIEAHMTFADGSTSIARKEITAK